MIEIQHITFGYGSKEVLNDVSLTIKPQSLTALIGLNGAGKSTLLRCLAKQCNIVNGKIVVDGRNIESYSFRSYSKIVSVVPQFSSIRQVDCKVRDFLVEGRTPYLTAFTVPGKREYQISEAFAVKMGIDKFLNAEFSKLSGGEQQLVLLTRALVQDTPIILLDEPMSTLDLKNQTFFLRIISQLVSEGKTVLFSTHNPNHAILLDCDVIMIKDGKIICHDTAKRCVSEENLNLVFGDSVHLIGSSNGQSVTLNI